MRPSTGVGLLIGSLTCSCANLSNLQGGTKDSGPSDAVVGDGPTSDAGPTTDAGPTAEGGDAGGCPGTGGYHDMASLACWDSFDLAPLANREGWYGGAFDGRYVYLAPNEGGIIAQFDTHASFTTKTSWSTFDATSVSTAAKEFQGVTFDGRYLYFVPNSGGSAGTVLRYDTKAPFMSASSYSTFDLTKVDANAAVFNGAVYDGRYVTFVGTEGDTSCYFARYDTHAPFGSASSYEVFDTAPVNADDVGYAGGLYDGRYVYAVPFTSSLVLRLDPTKPFASASSWSTFDLATANPNADGFVGGAFDGKALYFAPYQTAMTGYAVDFPVAAPFTVKSSWSAFDLANVQPDLTAFSGAAFDGKFVYFVPSQAGAFGTNANVVRYDPSAGPFTNASPWSSFDLTKIATLAPGYAGAVFDGRYLYLVPSTSSCGSSCASTLVVRFDARDTPAQPSLPAFFGSFL